MAFINRTIYVIKTGNTLPSIRETHNDFEDWIAQGLSTPGITIKHWDPRQQQGWPAQDDLAGVVITGSPAMVTDREEWSERTAAWLAMLVEENIPVLGICYGHQLLAHALGGTVSKHANGIEIGTVQVRCLPEAQTDPLFGAMPALFAAQVVHEQTVLELPAGAVALARNEHEPHHAFRVGSRAWGVQFHPEFSAQIMRDYVTHIGSTAGAPGPYAHEAGNVTPTPDAASLLTHFAHLVSQS